MEDEIAPYLNRYRNYTCNLRFDWANKKLTPLNLFERWRLAYHSMCHVTSKVHQIHKDVRLQVPSILATLPTRKHVRVKRTQSQLVSFFRENDVNYGMLAVRVYVVPENDSDGKESEQVEKELNEFFIEIGGSLQRYKSSEKMRSIQVDVY